MLEHLRRRIADTLATSRRVTLVTFGPADIQAGTLPCAFACGRLYLLVPRSSDQLFNLESNPQVVATTECWEMRGSARVLMDAERPPALVLDGAPEAGWSQWVEVCPERVQIRANGGAAETIDAD